MSERRARPGVLAQGSLRRHNMSIVLRHLRDRGRASRAQLAVATGMTKTGVSNIVQELIARQLVVELGNVGPTGRGRPSSMLEVNGSAVASIAMEINAFHTATVVTDLLGREVHRERLVVAGRRSPSEVVAALRPHLGRALEAALDSCQAVGSLVVAVPGFVDTARGVVVSGPTLGWSDVDLRSLLKPLVPEGVWLAFDSLASLASLAESRIVQAPTPPHSLVHLEFGVGVGSGYVLHGHRERGASGALGAIGHVPVGASGRECKCGRLGCLVTLVGLEAMLDAAAPDLLASPRSDPAELVDEVARRAGDGDATAVAGLRETAEHIGTAVAMVVSLFDPEVVLLGGYVKPLAEWVMPTVADKVAADIIDAHALRYRVAVSPLGADGALAGAGEIGRDRVFDDPDVVARALSRRSAGCSAANVSSHSEPAEPSGTTWRTRW
jgi:predicted NBD/HSP70 family sugar kinase